MSTTYYTVDIFDETGTNLLHHGAELFLEDNGPDNRRGVLKPYVKAAKDGVVMLKVDGMQFCKFNGKTAAVTGMRVRR